MEARRGRSLLDIILAREGQTLLTHLKEVGNLAAIKMRKINTNLESLAKVVGYLHDVGKIEKSIQDKIYSERKSSFDHTFLSFMISIPIFRHLDFENTHKLAALLSILSHHSVPHLDLLQNLLERYARRYKNEQPSIDFNMLEILLNELGLPSTREILEEIREYLLKEPEEIKETVDSFLRAVGEINGEKLRETFSMLYHALVISDWESSSGLKIPDKVDFVKIFQKIVNKSLLSISPYDKYSPNYTKIHRYISTGHKLPNRLIIQIPTGFGKTSAALFFALRKNRRTIYTLPVSTIIEDIYYNKLKVIPELEKYVGWYTSRYLSFYGSEEKRETDEDLDPIKYQFSKYLLNPFSITTLDKVLISMLNFGRYPIIDGLFRNSTLILDEPQLYDPKILFLFLEILRKFPESYGNLSLLVMSATVPTYFLEGLESLDFVKILPSYSSKLFTRINRTFIDSSNLFEGVELVNLKEEYVNYKDIEDAFKRYGKVIVKVNTVSKAQFLYEKLHEMFGNQVLLIHSRFLMKDRKQKLKEAIAGENSKKFILVTTQVIEAGVDISYNCLLTELTPMDSIIQAAGRVNRRREYTKPLPIFVYTPGEIRPGGRRSVPYTCKEMRISSEILKERKEVEERKYRDLLREYYLNIEKYIEHERKKAKDIVSKFRNSVWGWRLSERNLNLREGTITVDAVPVQFLDKIYDLFAEKKEKIEKATNNMERRKLSLYYTSQIQQYFVKTPYNKEILKPVEDLRIVAVKLKYSRMLGLTNEIYEEGEII